MDRQLRRAPDAEWVLVYRLGTSRKCNAKLVRAEPASVGYHLVIARSVNLINTLLVVENEMECTESRFLWFHRAPDRMMPLLDRDRPEQPVDQLKQLLGGPLPADRNGRAWLRAR